MAYGSSSGPSAPLRRRPSYIALGSLPTRPASVASVCFFCEPPAQEGRTAEEPSDHHFLDACTLCKSPLQRNKDIYMCRGNVPFCSEECRQEWVELEETREEQERNYCRSGSIKATAAASASAMDEQEGQKAAAVARRASRIFLVRATETVVAG